MSKQTASLEGRKRESTPKRDAVPSRAVVPIEGTGQEMVVQEWSVEFARTSGIPLRALHVAPAGTKASGDVFRYVRDLARKRGVEFSSQILTGPDPAAEIVQELLPTDVVVIGTRLLGTEYHLGSVTEALVRRAPCPVQVVRL